MNVKNARQSFCELVAEFIAIATNPFMCGHVNIFKISMLVINIDT